MRLRRLLLGLGLTAIGAFLVVAPTSPQALTQLSLRSGESSLISVPDSASFLGGPVQLRLVTPSPSCPTVPYTYGRSCTGLLPHPIAVWDCGRQPCPSNATNGSLGPPVASSEAMSFSWWADPGHSYEVRLDAGAPNASAGFPVQIWMVTPTWAGGLGGGVAGVGAVLSGLACRAHPPRPDPRPSDGSADART